MQRIPVVLACACALVGGPLHAQLTTDTTTAAFRPGEWGVGFVQGRSLTEAGVLRFTTSTRAWVLDGFATFDRQVISGGGIFGTDETAQSVLVSASLGPRWYNALDARLVRFAGGGISASYSRAEFVGSSSRDKFWSAGAYGEFGLQYMFTRHLGLGWRGTLSASRIAEQRIDITGPNTQEMTHYRLALEPVQVTGTIYF